MKLLIKISLVLAAVMVINIKESHAQIKAGAGMAFGSEIEQVGIQADVHYRFENSPAFQVGGGFIYYFPKDEQDFYEINVNGAFIFYEKYMFKSYGYSGLNYSKSGVSFDGSDVSEDAFGLNVGIGAEYDFNGVFAFGDLKYVISEFDQPVFTIGLRIPFGGS